MELNVGTTLLQNMVAKAMKGASCNKMIPITGFMLIKLENNQLTLITTDGINYMYVQEGKVSGDDFYVVVDAEIFSKLVAKTTVENIVLDMDESSNVLNIKGNGKYTIELPLNEEGELIKDFPDPLSKISDDSQFTSEQINLSTVRLILATAKSSLDDPKEGVRCYTGYYLSDKAVTTDTFKICGINIDLFKQPLLIYPETLNLIDTFTDENIEVLYSGNTVVFTTDKVSVYATIMDCIEDFQIVPISELLEQKFESKCKVYKSELLQLLDRLSLFVSQYDKNCIYLTFTRDGIQVESKKANSTELVQYVESDGFSSFTCCINIEMLTSQVKSNTGDVIEIHYGRDNAIKLTDGNVTQIIALSNDDRLE